jgi:hypothetical protein
MEDKNRQRDPERIERELAETRESIDSTVEELGERLAPSQLVDDAKNYVKETAMRGANTLWSRVNENAVPLAMIGGGLMWMMRSDGRGSHAYGPRAGGTYGARAGATAGHLTDRVRETASDLGEKASEMGESAMHATRRVQEQARNRFDQMREEQPLLLGLASLALGAVVGGLIPTTRREEELLGETRDQVVEAAAEAARTKAEQARRALEDEAQESQRARGGDGSERQGGGREQGARSPQPSGAPR